MADDMASVIKYNSGKTLVRKNECTEIANGNTSTNKNRTVENLDVNNSDTVTGKITVDTNNRCIPQRYDRNKALDNKRAACDRPASLEVKNGNLVISLDTFTFETFRVKMMNTIHLPNEGGTSRHINYTQVCDESGMTVQDTIRVKSWGALGKLADSKKGSVNITINMYRTTSRILVNGPDYQQLVEPMRSLLNKTLNRKEIMEGNKAIKNHIDKERKPKARKNTKVKHHRSHKEELEACMTQQGNLLGNPPPLPIDTYDHSAYDSDGNLVTCPTCEQEVDLEGPLCETCHQWYHYGCQGISGTNIQYIEDSNTPYLCLSCAKLIEHDGGSEQDNMSGPSDGTSGDVDPNKDPRTGTHSCPEDMHKEPQKKETQTEARDHTELKLEVWDPARERPTNPDRALREEDMAQGGSQIVEGRKCSPHGSNGKCFLPIQPATPYMIPQRRTPTASPAQPTSGQTGQLEIGMPQRRPPPADPGKPQSRQTGQQEVKTLQRISSPNIPRQPPSGQAGLQEVGIPERRPPSTGPTHDVGMQLAVKALPSTGRRGRQQDPKRPPASKEHDIETNPDGELLQQELETEQRKLRAKERQLKQREKTLEMREEEVNTITQQTALLKATVNRLEMRIRDIEQENRELKLRLLANESLPGQATTTAQATQQPPIPHELLITSMTSIILALIRGKEQPVTAPQEQAPRQHYPKTRHNHFRRSEHRYYHPKPRVWEPERRKAPLQDHKYNHHNRWSPEGDVFDYNHGTSHLETTNALPKEDMAPIFIDLTTDDDHPQVDEAATEPPTPGADPPNVVELTLQTPQTTHQHDQLHDKDIEEGTIENPADHTHPPHGQPFLEMILPPRAPDKLESAPST